MDRYFSTVLPLAMAFLGLLLVATPRLFVPLPVPLGIAPLSISMLRLPLSTADTSNRRQNERPRESKVVYSPSEHHSAASPLPVVSPAAADNSASITASAISSR